ncbi:MAG: hypothetical protein COW02_16415 [Comamonadaceae bacterium CG12_big_fil_rev_8_21_14_0_65_59_15]|nr:MAG: hypothetical protein COW02_16415 [Comamonadaceae bacterium CG12_big_fil_rev_8_21_14_0_65_59_15]
MTMPYPNITQIPNNEPDAVPALWNTRYTEIDANFLSLDGRVSASTSELTAARNGAASLDARLDQMDGDISMTSVDMQNMDSAVLKFALDQASLANSSVRSLRQNVQQEGEFTIFNRGIVLGCAATKSVNAARNLNLSAGVCFANGRSYLVVDGINSASVPSNAGAIPVTVYAYLYKNATGLFNLAVTPIGSILPSDAIKIYNITIPSGSTDSTDPYLSSVTLTDARRIEANYPNILDSPALVSSVLNAMDANDYRLDFDVVSSSGAPCDASSIVVTSRATNGFTVALASAADNVVVRWRASRLSLPSQTPVIDFSTGFHASNPTTY